MAPLRTAATLRKVGGVTAPLRPDQLAAFAEDGYIVLPGVLCPDELAALRLECDRILDLVLNSSVAMQRRNPRLDLSVLADGTARVRKVQPINDLSTLVASVSCDPRLIGPMGQLMDDVPVLMEEKLNLKQDVAHPDLDLSFITRTYPEDFPLHHDWGSDAYRQLVADGSYVDRPFAAESSSRAPS